MKRWTPGSPLSLPVSERLARLVVGDGGADEIVRAAVHAAELRDLLVRSDDLLELLEALAVVGVDLHVDEHLQAAPERGRVRHGPIPGDDARLLQPPDTAQARGRCEADPFGQFDVGQTSVLAQEQQDFTVDRI